MPDAPFTIRDGWHFPIRDSRRSSWLASPERHPAHDVPCLVVTGDLAAARARLAPDSDHLLADALLAIIDLDGCRGDCGDQTGACVPARIRAYLGWETTHE